MRPAFYMALSHLAQDRPVEPGFVCMEDVTKTTRGEHAHHILQALCRGKVRKSEGDRCHPMSAYVIASARSGIEELMPEVFPGCKVQSWLPVAKPPKGKLKAAMSFIDEQRNDDVKSVSNVALAEAVGIEVKNLARDVTGKPEWTVFMAERGVKVRKGKKGSWDLKLG